MNNEFIVGCDYEDGFSAFFEQDDATGYLYAVKDKKVFQHLHIYNRATQVPEVKEDDVQIIRTDDGRRVAVAIWRELRGIIDVSSGETFKDSKGIVEESWLIGFDYEFKKDTSGITRAFVLCD